MNISESIWLALESIKVNKLRSSLTLLSVSIGVFAIIGAGSLVDSINSSVTSELSAMGQSTFYIYKMPGIQMGNTWRKYRKRKPITYSIVKELKKKMTTAKLVSSISKSFGNTVKSSLFETDPDVNLFGADEYYLELYNTTLQSGRPFTAEDLSFNRNVAIIGNDVVLKIFPNVSPLGQKIKIKNQSFTVIGVLESKGAIMGQSQDNVVLIPVPQFLTYYASFWEESLTISIKAESKETLEKSIDEAIGIMRGIRNLKPWQENDFEVETNETIAEQFASFTGFLTYFGFFSGAIALIAAGVGIMNIMLVSVKERTREIGIRKAIGAKKSWILLQFIIETITLCQIGGLIGMLLGTAGSAFFGTLMSIKLSMPWNWVIISVVICTVLGIISGAYPAWKAAKLDPIDALRYE
jgi:putative ABC transport system permease protein